MVNLLIGPPERPEDDRKVLRLFFSKEGKHVVCGAAPPKWSAAIWAGP